MRFHRAIFLRLLLAISCVAQQAGEPTVTFKSSSTLVIVTVFVRDRDGKPVEGLTKGDFKLLEDGKPQNITSDRDRLIEVIKSFRIGEGTDVGAALETGDEDEQDTQAAFTADQSEFNIFNTDQKLSALESAAKMLGSLPERKALVYFSSGVGKTGTENESQLRSTVNAAVRANVAFYPVDARGLVALPPGGDATNGASRGTGK